LNPAWLALFTIICKFSCSVLIWLRVSSSRFSRRFDSTSPASSFLGRKLRTPFRMGMFTLANLSGILLDTKTSLTIVLRWVFMEDLHLGHHGAAELGQSHLAGLGIPEEGHRRSGWRSGAHQLLGPRCAIGTEGLLARGHRCAHLAARMTTTVCYGTA